jgi:hypothetical protein
LPNCDGGNANLLAQAAANLELTPEQLQQAMQLIEQPDQGAELRVAVRHCTALRGDGAPGERHHGGAPICCVAAGQRFEWPDRR